MKLTILLPLLSLASGSALFPRKPTTTSTTPTPTPTTLLPPPKFLIKIINAHTLTPYNPPYLTLPSPLLDLSFPLFSTSGSPLYFKQKEADGQGIVFSTPDRFAPPSFALSYNFTVKGDYSRVCLSDFEAGDADTLFVVDLKAQRLGDVKEDVGKGDRGREVFVYGSVDAKKVFRFDEKKGELWIGLGGSKFPLVYLEIVATN